MLRESVERRAQDAGRLTQLHAVCALMLENLYREGHRGIDERRAHHYWEAGHFDEAAPALLAAARQRENGSEYDRALSLLDRCEQALDAAAAAVEQRTRLECWSVRARIFVRRSQAQNALVWTERLLSHAVHAGFADLEATALWVRSQVWSNQGDYDAVGATAMPHWPSIAASVICAAWRPAPMGWEMPRSGATTCCAPNR
jgi:hypothetical protein